MLTRYYGLHGTTDRSELRWVISNREVAVISLSLSGETTDMYRGSRLSIMPET